MPNLRLSQIISFLLIALFIESSGFCSCSRTKTNAPGSNSNTPSKSELAKENVDASKNVSPERIAELEKRFNDSPASYISASDLANAYAKIDQLDKALSVLDKYIKNAEGPDVERAKIDKAILKSKSGQAEEAYKELLTLAENKEGKLRGEEYFQLGNMIATGKYAPPEGDKVELAKKYFESALDYGEVDPLLYRRLADLTHSENQLEAAREYLAIYLAVYPYDGESWVDLGNWSVEAKDYKRAKEYYKRALESNKEDVRKKAQAALGKLPES